MLKMRVPVAGPMPVSLQAWSRAFERVVVDGDVIVESVEKARDVCFSTVEASFLRTIPGRKGREWP